MDELLCCMEVQSLAKREGGRERGEEWREREGEGRKGREKKKGGEGEKEAGTEGEKEEGREECSLWLDRVWGRGSIGIV